ncbi:MAG: hypothetical protein R3300_01245 [Candidatus Promineifilaceae bacterium]|nr:hypothetical protein [Candidatus Promineifilaceae bacterium]
MDSRDPGEPAADSDILQRAIWLIRLRWVAGFLTLLFTFYLDQLRQMTIPATGLYLTGVSFLLYNAFFAWYVGSSSLGKEQSSRARASIIPQLSLDLLGLLAFIHLSGGACSPLVPLVTVTAVVGALLLRGRRPYLYAAAILVGLVGLAWIEGNGLIAHQGAVVVARACDPTNIDQVVLNLFFTLVAVVGIVTLLTGVSGRQVHRLRS